MAGAKAGRASRASSQSAASTLDDHRELPRLDPEIERQQRGGHLALRQTDFLERAGKPEAVDKAEGEGDAPRIAQRDALAVPQQFGSEKHDRQRDQCLDRRLRQAHQPERDPGKRQRVRHGERGHRLGHRPPAPHQQHQRDDEQQVVPSGEDVGDAQLAVSAPDLPAGGFGGEDHRWVAAGSGGSSAPAPPSGATRSSTSPPPSISR